MFSTILVVIIHVMIFTSSDGGATVAGGAWVGTVVLFRKVCCKISVESLVLVQIGHKERRGITIPILFITVKKKAVCFWSLSPTCFAKFDSAM
jgi:hypothetical protein